MGALVGSAIGLISGLATAYVAMRFRLREERAKWARDIALKYAVALADQTPIARSLAQQFGSYLLVVHEPGRERRKHFLVAGARATVGRDPNVDLHIDDKFASRQHMTFEVREDGVFAIDFLTRGGTQVNGTPLQGSARLESGDVVTVGDTYITLVSL